MATATTSRAFWTTVKVLSVLASAVMAAALAIWIGVELGQEINAGVPDMGSRFVLAAVLLIPSVVLVVAHSRPTLFSSRPVWWSSPVIAAASLTWLYVAQSTMLHSLDG